MPNLEKSRKLLLENKILSVPVLQRKLKITAYEAHQILKELAKYENIKINSIEIDK